MFLSLRASDRCHRRGNPFPPSPRRRRGNPFFTFASGGHLSFNSERKVRKNATKTYGFGFPQRAISCHKLASCLSRNCLSRVPLSVKRTVPPQLSAAAACCHGSRFPLYRRTGVLPIPTQPPSLELSFRASAHTGVAIRSPIPAPQARHPFLRLPPAVTFLSIAKER